MSWKERDFEQWFLAKPVLPGGETLIPLFRQQALRRVVDLLCLDATGGLVLIEVKNEASSRTAVGQALEYLSQYEDAELEQVLEELPPPSADAVRQRIADHGWAVRELTPRRRVILAAPAFDLPTQAATAFLKGRFARADIELGLLAVRQADHGFSLELLDPARPRSPSQLRGKCGLTGRGRLFLVLPTQASGIVLNLGRLQDGTLRVSKGPTATRRLVRRRFGSLVPYDGPITPDLSEIGRKWAHRTRPWQATQFALLRPTPSAPPTLLFYLVESQGAFKGFRIRAITDFREAYSPLQAPHDDWESRLLTALRDPR